MGLTKDRPPFAKAYFDLRTELKKAVSSYKNDVEQGKL